MRQTVPLLTLAGPDGARATRHAITTVWCAALLSVSAFAQTAADPVADTASTAPADTSNEVTAGDPPADTSDGVTAGHAVDVSAAVAPEPRHRLWLTTTGIGRVYPTGLDVQARLTLQQRLGDSQDLLFKTRHWNVSAMGGINPANWTAGVSAQYEPIAVFQLKAQYEARGFFGNFGALLSGDETLPITDLDLAAADKRGETQRAVGQVFTVQPTLQARVGPIAVQEIFAASYNLWDVRDGDTAVYDPGSDMLVPTHGVTLANTALVAWVGDALTVGGLHQYLAPVSLDGGNDVHRAGALAAWSFWDTGARKGFFNKATLTVVSLFNVQHRGRAGFVPTVVAVLSADSDLF